MPTVMENPKTNQKVKSAQEEFDSNPALRALLIAALNSPSVKKKRISK